VWFQFHDSLQKAPPQKRERDQGLPGVSRGRDEQVEPRGVLGQ
jgi:hypothetical protein